MACSAAVTPARPLTHERSCVLVYGSSPRSCFRQRGASRSRGHSSLLHRTSEQPWCTLFVLRFLSLSDVGTASLLFQLCGCDITYLAGSLRDRYGAVLRFWLVPVSMGPRHRSVHVRGARGFAGNACVFLGRRPCGLAPDLQDPRPPQRPVQQHVASSRVAGSGLSVPVGRTALWLEVSTGGSCVRVTVVSTCGPPQSPLCWASSGFVSGTAVSLRPPSYPARPPWNVVCRLRGAGWVSSRPPGERARRAGARGCSPLTPKATVERGVPSGA